MKLTRLITGLLLLCAACAPAATPQSSTAASQQAPALESPTPPPKPGDGAAYGRVLFYTMQHKAGFACVTCHFPGSDSRLIGPGLRGLRERVEKYDLGVSVEDYLHEAIVEPDVFLAPGEPAYPGGIMPRNYADIFTERELSDLIAYLLTL